MIENINNEIIDTLLNFKLDENVLHPKRISSCLRVAVNMNDLKNVPNPRGYLNRFEKNTNKYIPALSPLKKRSTIPYPTKTKETPKKNILIMINAPTDEKYYPKTDLLLKYFQQWKVEVNQIKQKRQIDSEHEKYRSRFEYFLENLKNNKTSVSTIENDCNKNKKVNRTKKSPTKLSTIKRSISIPLKSDESDLNRIDRELKQSMAETRESKKSLISKLPSRQPLTILKSSQMALQRQQHRLQILERKRQSQEQRQQQLLEEEKRQKILMIREKQEQAEAIREKRRLEQEQELYLNVIKAQYVQQQFKARYHYEKNLKSKALKQWKLVCEIRQSQMNIAVEFDQINTLRKVIEMFKKFTQDAIEIKNKLADNFYNHNLLRLTFSDWKCLHQEMKEHKQVAEDYYDFQLCSRTFYAWFRYTEDSLVFNEKLMLKASKYYKRRLLCKFFGHWIELPIIMKALREKEERKEKWIRRVQDILPNFQTSKENTPNKL